jgi:hypothetical protein
MAKLEGVILLNSSTAALQIVNVTTGNELRMSRVSLMKAILMHQYFQMRLCIVH